MTFQIETERLTLRDVREDDFRILLAQFAEPAGRSNILAHQADENYNKQSLEIALAWANAPQRENYTLSVILKAGQILIGSTMLYNARPGSIETSLGWHYGSRFWGRGYATEAARVLLDIGFGIVRVNEIFADCFADNRASIRVMEKIGMKTLRNHGLFNRLRGISYGEPRPVIRHLITRNEWSDNRK
jgi:ribosomal-protein-alanine N-acetyltransferase